MSSGLGLWCEDGIVLGCDSAGIFDYGVEITREDLGKSYSITDRIRLVGTGGGVDPILLVEEITDRLPEHPEIMSARDFRIVLEDSADFLHNHHNLKRPPMAPNDTDLRYDCTGIVGFSNVDGNLELLVVLPNGNVDITKDWCLVGSLAVLGEYLMQRLYSPNITIKKGLRIAHYVLSEIVRSDPGCGGQVRLGYIRYCDPYVDLVEEEILAISSVVQERRSLLHDRIYRYVFDDDFNFVGF